MPKEPNTYHNPYIENLVQWLSATIMALDVHYMDSYLVHNAATSTLKHFSARILELLSGKI